MDWRERFDAEIRSAERARQRGNEGRARVCARRAAGIIARQHLAFQGPALKSESAMDWLRHLEHDPALPEDLRRSIHYLGLQVNREFKLPPGVDLILEARRLRDRLLGTDS